MGAYAYYNGKFGTKNEITIPLTDRALYFGDGIYDVAIGTRGKMFLGGEHIDRILGNAKKLGIEAPTHEELEKILCDVIKKSELSDFMIYYQLSRSNEKRSHSAFKCKGYNLLVTVDDFKLSTSEKKLKLITRPDVRFLYCDIKTVNLLPAVIACTDAEKAGVDEAVFVRDGYVTECAHSNISIIKDGVFITHPANNLILPGITRKHILSACKTLGIPYVERPFTTEEMFAADEVVVSGTTKFCKCTELIDNIAVGGKNPQAVSAIYEVLHNEYLNF